MWPALLCISLVTTTGLAADPAPFLKSAPMPFYPPLALQARVQGEVVVRIHVNQSGDTTAEFLSGHALLRHDTLAYVEGWKFGWAFPCACEVAREVRFIYRIAPDSPAAPITTVRWIDTSRVEITVEPARIEGRIEN